MTAEKKPYLAMASAQELADFAKNNGVESYRAKQIERWVSKRWTVNPDSMTDLSQTARRKLHEAFLCDSVSIAEEHFSSDGAGKLLLRLHDGEFIECALIPAADGRMTFCLSTQVGCPVHCAFCASGKGGFVRNLAAGEIVEQFFCACRKINSLPDNVVIMGIGEPLLNLDNLQRRGTDLLKSFWRRHLFGLPLPVEPMPAKQRAGLFFYGISAFTYRIFLYTSIILIVYFNFTKTLGIVLLSLEVYLLILKPIYDEGKFLYMSRRQMRAVTVPSAAVYAVCCSSPSKPIVSAEEISTSPFFTTSPAATKGVPRSAVICKITPSVDATISQGVSLSMISTPSIVSASRMVASVP